MTDVHRASPEQWRAVKDIRLRALTDSPRAFGSSLVREVAFEDGDWQRRVPKGTWFLAWSSGHPVGVVAMVAQEDAPLERHVVRMWVEPAQRGAGVAHDLVDAVCDVARAEGAAAVSLWVADGNARARRFYDNYGFVSTGARRPLASAPEIQEERLALVLLPSTPT